MRMLTIALALLLSTGDGALAASPAHRSGHDPKPSPSAHPAQRSHPWEDPNYFAAYYKAERDLEHQLQESPSPRDWALSTQLGQFDDSDSVKQARGELLRKAAQLAPEDPLVEWLWALADRNESGCDDKSPCPDRTSAPSRRDPGNFAAWLIALDGLGPACGNDKEGDFAVDRILSKLTVASRYDFLARESTAAWEDVYRRFPVSVEELAGLGRRPLTVASNRLQMAWSMSERNEPGSYALEIACDREFRRDLQRPPFEGCAAVGRRMIALATTLQARSEGITVLRTSGRATEDDLALARIVHWQPHAACGLWPSQRSQFVSRLANMEDAARDGNEVRALKERLVKAGIPLTPPVGWQPMNHGRPISPLEDPEISGCYLPRPIAAITTEVCPPVPVLLPDTPVR